MFKFFTKNKNKSDEKVLLDLIVKSDIFDKRYYLSQYKDAKTSNLSAIEHFVKIGLKEHRNPNSEFNAQWYIQTHKDVQQSGMNPLIHYVKYGKKENRETNEEVKIDFFDNEITLQPLGEIIEYRDGNIYGWYHSAQNTTPLLFVNGKTCKIVKTGIRMPEIAEEFDLDRENIGFVAKVTTNFSNASEIELYAIYADNCKKILSTKDIKINRVSPRSLGLLKRLKEISLKKDAVIIVLWDATHNPMGRAKVLYDILKNADRAVVIVGFDFGFSTSEVWEPLLTSDVDLVTLRWNEKEIFKQIVDEMDISFETVWICKPRFAGFVLADMFSNEDSHFILDIDDNEKEFSLSENQELMPYGELSNYLAESITAKIAAKSVASISIQERWGGRFVRHARVDVEKSSYGARAYLPEVIKIGFFGTVRPHKNLQAVAKAVKEFGEQNNIAIELTVGGHFIPSTLEDEILSFGAKTVGAVENRELSKTLASMDILITGYPSDEDEITKYQISSKIADALSVGRAILVPESSSVSDLNHIDGIYLFSEENFSQKLKEAILNKKEIKLDKIFTFSHNYTQFLKLEESAKKNLKKDIFTTPLSSHLQPTTPLIPTLVLVWKQPDSSLYGRRVDQIARSYKRKSPNHRVILLELVSSDRLKQYENSRDIFAGDDAMVLERIRNKREGLTVEGVEHRVVFDTQDRDEIRDFLLINRILPLNTVFILFPIVNQFSMFINLIDNYEIITDVVDNQLGWSSKYPEQIVMQYKVLAKLNSTFIFNSQKNRDFFYEHNILEKNQKSKLIKNWYELPKVSKELLGTLPTDTETKLFYSGNMNDRMDWTLIKELLKVLPKNTRLYLIGNAQRCAKEIKDLLNQHNNCSYLGPLDERTLVEFISSCHLAIMPHSVESTSMYMNPLKVHMYAAVGIESVSTDVPGLENRFQNLTIAQDAQSFIETCMRKIEIIKQNSNIKHTPIDLTFTYKESRDVYLDLIENKFKALTII